MNKIALTVTLFLSGFLLSACDINEGGPEEMGENIEEAATDLGNEIEDACERAKQEANAADTNC